MFLLRVILFPLAVIYDLITGVRNKLYDLGLRPSSKFEVPVVCVGNLTVGGTGKTPMIEHLIRLLGRHYKVATLSRGYGRMTKGVRIAEPSDNARTLGDEPIQLYKKFGDKVVVAVGEERAYAIPIILDRYSDIQVILMDDAFQHRSVKPALSVLLTDYNRPFYNDFLLPAGRLRESRAGADRADVVVVTKCPVGISDDSMMEIAGSIRRYTDKPVFFAAIRYGTPIAFGSPSPFENTVILLTGIANALSIRSYIESNFQLLRHIEYSDHHHYTHGDITSLRAMCRSDVSIITTEKDMVKIDIDEFRPMVLGMPFFYLPIEIDFIKSGRDFDALVQTIIRDRH